MVVHPPKEEQTDHLYSMKKLNVVFGVSCVLFLLSIMAVMIHDSSRGWKKYQKQFEAIEVARAEKEIAELQKAIDPNEVKSIQGELDKAKEVVSRNKSVLKKLKKEVRKFQKLETRAKTKVQGLKSKLDAKRYEYETLLEHDNPKAPKFKKKYDKLVAEVDAAEISHAEYKSELDRAEKELREFTAQGEKLEEAIKKLYADIDRLKQKKEMLSPGLVKAVRNFPLLNFIKPTQRVLQTVVPDLTEDYYFTKVERVDRCETCHVGIDNPHYADAKQPFKQHPRLTLFVGERSPHPKEKFGCTACHAGNGRVVDFIHAGHEPDSLEKTKTWEKKYGWHRLEEREWNWAMFSRKDVEASCYQCHASQWWVDGAEKLNLGRTLFAEYGCYGCHATKGFEKERKAGPPLTRILSKVNKEWLVRWIEDPRSFRPTTRMPSFFGLSNVSDPESAQRSNVEIQAIASYLETRSHPYRPVQKVAVEGSKERGKQLVFSVGCLGCHSVGKEAKVNYFGPDLLGLGSKLKREWLVDWLIDPKHYFPQTKMPRLRLTEQEAADIGAYLMSERVRDFDKRKSKQIQFDQVRTLALEHMSEKMPPKAAEQKLSSMSETDQLLFVGERSIARYGCYGCHDIAGFEKARGIGVELTQVGSKPLERFDFGFVKIADTRRAWFVQKLKDPRSFDFKKVKRPKDKLIMPKFNLSSKQIDALATFLSGLTGVEASASKRRILSDRDMAIERGRFEIREHNCIGCHIVEGRGGTIRAQYQDEGQAPPNLLGEGRKVKPIWLYGFLKDVKPIRGWLKVRMPSFDFDDEDLNDLLAYFSALDQQPFPFETEHPHTYTPEQWAQTVELFQVLRCEQCHVSGGAASSGLSASAWAPDLGLARARLRRNWIMDWLRDPQKLMPGTMMPGYFTAGTPVPHLLKGNVDLQIEALADYVQQIRK